MKKLIVLIVLFSLVCFSSDVFAISAGAGKVKADSSDTAPGFLDAKVDGSTIQVNASDQLEVQDVFLRNDASDSTSGTITAAGFTSAGNLTIGGTNTLSALNTANGLVQTDGSGVLSTTLTPSGLTSISATTLTDGTLSTTAGAVTGIASGTIADDGWIGIASDQERIVFDSAGDVSVMGANVGVGTDSPTFKLEVAGQMRTVTASGTAPLIDFTQSATKQWQIGNPASTTRFSVLEDGTNDRLSVIAGGNVGIGTTSPGCPLHVYNATTNRIGIFESGDQDASISFKDNTTFSDTTVSIGARGDEMFFNTNDSTQMWIDSSGNVGIGTTSPGAKLEINGDIIIGSAYGVSIGGTNAALLIDDSGNVGTTTSTRETKKNIEPVDDLDWMDEIEVIQYNPRVFKDGQWSDDTYDVTYPGMIVEDIIDYIPEKFKKALLPQKKIMEEVEVSVLDVKKGDIETVGSGTDSYTRVCLADKYKLEKKSVAKKDKDGNIVTAPFTINYRHFIPFLIKKVQLLEAEIAQMKKDCCQK